MIPRVLITLGVAVYALVIPYLELNASHLLNEAWPAHARLHEAWQLTTNAAIGLNALWLAWGRNQIRIASLLNIAVMGGVLVAHLFEGSYGGSILSGNLQKTVLGLDVAAFAALVVVALAVLAFLIGSRQPAARSA